MLLEAVANALGYAYLSLQPHRRSGFLALRIIGEILLLPADELGNASKLKVDCPRSGMHDTTTPRLKRLSKKKIPEKQELRLPASKFTYTLSSLFVLFVVAGCENCRRASEISRAAE